MNWLKLNAHSFIDIADNRIMKYPMIEVSMDEQVNGLGGIALNCISLEINEIKNEALAQRLYINLSDAEIMAKHILALIDEYKAAIS